MNSRLSYSTASSAPVETGVPSLAPSLPTSPPPVRKLLYCASVAFCDPNLRIIFRFYHIIYALSVRLEVASFLYFLMRGICCLHDSIPEMILQKNVDPSCGGWITS